MRSSDGNDEPDARCGPGLVDCDGGCIATDTDPQNCGGCGSVCPPAAHADGVCVAGTCAPACEPGFEDCNALAADGCETDVNTDPDHCGSCANACDVPHAQPSCAGGVCTITSCDSSFADCNNDVADGCEVDVTQTTSDCGGCGFDCSPSNVVTAACVGGMCSPTCAAPWADCNGPASGDADDGCETNLASDTNNCGVCGQMCAAGAKCCAGACQDTTNCALTATSVQPTGGWQSGGDWVTVSGTGFAAGVKVYLADGVASAYARDSTTIVLQTPPHPVGAVDVKIVQGVDTIIVHGGFSYGTGGVLPPWQHKAMHAVRGEIPGLTVLQNGRVLVVGCTTVPDSAANSLNTGEVYDTVTDAVTLVGNTMSTPRWRDSAVTMLTGRALLTGGCSGCAGGNSRAVDLYDPATNAFSPGPPLAYNHDNVKAVLMPDGRVFVSSASTPNVELYDPIANTFQTIPHTQSHLYGFIVRLRDGRVMIGGGDGGNRVVELFDPATGNFSTKGQLNTARAMLTAHTLPDGRVIVIGGTNVSAGGGNAPQKTMEYWSPTTGVWTMSPVQLTTPRSWHASALVRDGTILVMGDYSITGSCTPAASVEEVDPVAGTVSPFPALLNPNTEWVAATMLDGSVMGVGGGACGTSSALPDLDFLSRAP